MSFVLWIVAGLMVLRLLGEWCLSALNRAEVRRHATQAPPAVAAIMDEATYQKSVAYTLERSRFGQLTELFDTLVLMLVIFGGALPWLYSEVVGWGGPEAVWSRTVYLLLVGVLLAVPGLPFEWWSQFRLEAKYGFNKSTPALWVVDKFKGLGLMLVIGFVLLWVLLSLVDWVGNSWWLWGFGVLFGFQILMLVLYPKLILPIFNKLTPLPDGELRDRLMALGERTGFKAQAIEVMDGSKRSGHSNAFFTGFGRFRRIVLFDTLMNQLSTEELEAVLAHEIGHYRRGHIPKMIAVSAGMQLGGFALIAWLARSYWFNPAFGFPPGELAPSLLMFGLLSGLVTFWFSPIGNLFSRKHEYEADAFARDAMGGASAMIGALRKLAQKNLSNLTPHPWFSAFYYSHPTLVERERALQAVP
ncbi:MAG: M48 family metallopeptidase [Cephaloticoccus sp.]|nr:M48 family metallopeptidase [Cephaloticoccus sp.]MCF7760529.1 M48 family metallopeptidase [Cephaloticoccus sp.]